MHPNDDVVHLGRDGIEQEGQGPHFGETAKPQFNVCS